MILYIENPNNSTQKNLLEVVNEFGKVTGFKINIQNSVAFLHTNNKLSENISPIFNFPERIKYLRINLTK